MQKNVNSVNKSYKVNQSLNSRVQYEKIFKV